MNFVKFLRKLFPVEHLRWLLLGPFLGCQSMWYFSKNTIFSRMNIIFFGDARDITPRCIFSGQGHPCFFLPGGNVMVLTPTRICRKYYISKRFLIKIIFFHFPPKEKIYFLEKKKHLSRYYKKDHVQARIFWKNYLFRTFEENIIFPDIFLRKIIFRFVSKE